MNIQFGCLQQRSLFCIREVVSDLNGCGCGCDCDVMFRQEVPLTLGENLSDVKVYANFSKPSTISP